MEEAKQHQRTCTLLMNRVKNAKTEEERQQAMEDVKRHQRIRARLRYHAKDANTVEEQQETEDAKQHQRTCARLRYHVRNGKTVEERQRATEELEEYRKTYKYKKQNARTKNQRRYYYKTTLKHLLEAETLNVRRIAIFLDLYKAFDPDDKFGIIAAAVKVLEQDTETTPPQERQDDTTPPPQTSTN